MADGHDPKEETPLSAFLARGIHSREEADTAVMAAVFRQTQLLEVILTLTEATMRVIDKNNGHDHTHIEKVITPLKGMVQECKQINAALLDYAGSGQKDGIDGER